MVNALEKNKEIDPQLCGRFATDSYIAIDIAHKYNWVNLWVETDSSFVVWLFHSNSILALEFQKPLVKSCS